MTPITAPAAVVHTWREEAARVLDAAQRPTDPKLVAAVAACPREVGELVAHLVGVLVHAHGILLGSAINATPGALDLLAAGLLDLLDEHLAEQERDPDREVAGDDGCEGGAA
jgi:hypothetical protein